MKLRNKTTIITGASAGIGEAIALKLAWEGTRLALLARNEEKLNNVAERCLKLGAERVEVYPCDISEIVRIPKIIAQIKSDFWAIDILINNAGIWQKRMQLDEIEKDMIDPIIQTNLSGVIHMTHSVLPIMRELSEAAIINIVSQSGVVSQDGQSIYTATKFGVRGFTDVLKKDLADINIRIAGIYQSWTNTKMFENTWETMPIEKFTDPNDLADVIRYMLSLPPKIWMHDVRVCY